MNHLSETHINSIFLNIVKQRLSYLNMKPLVTVSQQVQLNRQSIVLYTIFIPNAKLYIFLIEDAAV